MKRIQLPVFCLVVALTGTLTAYPALAQGRGNGRGKAPQGASPDAGTVAVQYELGSRDRDLITTYYTTRASGLPPGLAKRDDGLPPGLEQQLRKNGTLPPGLQKKIQPFPLALARQLTPLAAGYRRGIVGAHVVVYKPGTNVIVDVMLNVVR